MMPITIGNLVNETALMLGNRGDLTSGSPSLIAGWLRDAYVEIAMNYPFDELEDSQQMSFVPGVDTYSLPATARGIKAFTLLFPAGGAEPREIRRRHIRNIRRFQTVNPGPPAVYAPLTPQGQSYRSVVVRPIPDQAYSATWDLWINPTITSDIVSTILQVPPDWLEIIRYMACLRAHVELQERDKANEVRMILYGGQDANTGRRWPGLLKSRELSRMADQDDVEYNIAPRVRRYTAVP